MTLRFRLVLFAAIMAVSTLVGSATIIMNINSLSRNQKMRAFKNSMYQKHMHARELIQKAQSLIYQHKAGYTHDIDSLVNNIYEFELLLHEIPELYWNNYREPYCLRCHPHSPDQITRLVATLNTVQYQTQRYKESVSTLITTSDPDIIAVQHRAISELGQIILDTIHQINSTALQMISELSYDTSQLLYRTRIVIATSVIVVAVMLVFFVAYVLSIFHRIFSTLIQGTDSISHGDFRLRLPKSAKNNELGLISDRFNHMSEQLQKRDEQIEEKSLETEKAYLKVKDLNDTLEERISERTAELEASVNKLQLTASELQKSQRKIEAANLDLVHANQAKADFLSIVSHELKTPLSVINGFLSLILDDRYRNDTVNLMEAVQICKRRGEQLSRMIDELIDLSRLDAHAMILNMERVAPATLLRETAEQLQEDLQRKHIRLSYDLPPHLPLLTCDPAKFQQIFINLLGNAIKFSPEGEEIKLGCEERENDFLFTCRDKGIGIPPQEQEKIFDKFYQVDSSATRRYGGAGLGLSIVREIVRLHGGEIWVKSAPGEGACFFLTFPKGGGAESGTPSAGRGAGKQSGVQQFSARREELETTPGTGPAARFTPPGGDACRERPRSSTGAPTESKALPRKPFAAQ